MKKNCPVCGCLTIEAEWDVCPVCFWENENLSENEVSGANHGLTLAKARENYTLYGACEEQMKSKVRPPLENELPENRSFGAAEKSAVESYLMPFFKSISEQDRCAVVICNVLNEIVYMNPAAMEHYKRFNVNIGDSIFDCHNEQSRKAIIKVCDWFKKSTENNIVYTHHNEQQNKDVYMVALRNDNGEYIGYYEKHEFRNPEVMNLYDLK